MHDTLTPAERKQLLAMAGLSAELVDAVEAVEHTTPTIVAQAVIEAVPVPVPVPVVPVEADDEPVSTIDDVVKRILDRSAGNKDKALKLADDHAQAEFDRVKLSKVQAAAQGVDSKEHNRAAWAHCQKVRESLKTQIRAQFRDNGGFVKAKVKGGKSKPSPELDAFLLANQDNPVLRQFLALNQG